MAERIHFQYKMNEYIHALEEYQITIRTTEGHMCADFYIKSAHDKLMSAWGNLNDEEKKIVGKDVPPLYIPKDGGFQAILTSSLTNNK